MMTDWDAKQRRYRSRPPGRRSMLGGATCFRLALASTQFALLLFCASGTCQTPESSLRFADGIISEQADPIGAEIAFQQAVIDDVIGNDDRAIGRLETSQDTIGAHFRGVLHLKSGNTQDASAEFQAIVDDASAPVETAQLLSHVQNTAAAETPRNFDTPSVQSLSYEQTLCADCDADAPCSDCSRSLSFTQPVDRSENERPYHLTFLMGSEYDSNVLQSPEFVGLGAISNRDDIRLFLAGFGDILLHDGPNSNAGLITSVFASFHDEQRANDLQDYMGGGYANAGFGPLMAGVHYEFHESRLGQQHLLSDHRLVSSISLLAGELGHATAYYEFDSSSSGLPVLVPAQRLGGETHAVGATGAIYTFGGNGRIYAGYRYADVQAVGSDFDRFTHMVTARIERPIRRLAIVDAEFRYFWEDYENANSLDFFERSRYDERVTVRFGFQRILSQRLALRTDYTFASNNSNVENLFGVNLFDYTRHVLSSQIIWDF